MKKMLVWTLILTMMVSMFAGCGNKAEEAPAEDAAVEEEAPVVEEDAEAAGEEVAEEAIAQLTSIADLTWKEGYETGTVDIAKDYYEFFGIDGTTTLRGTGGWAIAASAPTEFAKAKEEYTIGLAMYFTLDDTAKAIVETVQEAADAAGINLLIHDANNDQNAQNQAVENWILEGVDGVILFPADFYTVQTALDQLKTAGIPVVAGNAPMAGEVDSVTFLANDDIGRMTGEIMCEKLLEKQDKVEGKIIYGTLPTFHPNAVTRLYGFQEVVNKYAEETGGEVEYIEVTGLTQEDFYTKFQDALMANPDAVMCWGVMATTVIGMNEAAKDLGVRPVIGGVDMDRAILAGIKAGEIDCTVGYNSFDCGYWTVNLIVDKLNGLEIPGVLQRPVTPATAENCEEVFVEYYGMTIDEFINGAE